MEKVSRLRPKFSTKHNGFLLMWMVFMHAGALGVFFTFTWKAFGLFLLFSWLTLGLGICLGYHRYFTHRSYETPRFFAYFLAILGSMAAQGGPIHWVASHRYHHANADKEKDPHSPLRGIFWAHMGWLFGREKFLTEFESYKNYATDLTKDRFLVLLDRNHMLPAVILGIMLYALGGWAWLVWGLFARTIFVYHATWLVNSATHLWGYRSYATADQSRNNWWVAILTFGEGWHNNHHAFQHSARHGLQWWEIDATYITIKILSFFGFARQIHLPPPKN